MSMQNRPQLFPRPTIWFPLAHDPCCSGLWLICKAIDTIIKYRMHAFPSFFLLQSHFGENGFLLSSALAQLFYTSDLEEEQQMEEGVRSACSCVMSLSLSWQVLMGALPADVGGGERLMNRPKTNNGSMARQILRPQTTDQPTNLTNHLRTYPPTSIHKQPTFPPLANIEPPQCERSALSPPLPLPSVRSSGEEGDKHGTHTSTQREGPCLLLASAMAASLVREYRDMLCLGIFQCGTPATDERERED